MKKHLECHKQEISEIFVIKLNEVKADKFKCFFFLRKKGKRKTKKVVMMQTFVFGK